MYVDELPLLSKSASRSNARLAGGVRRNSPSPNLSRLSALAPGLSPGGRENTGRGTYSAANSSLQPGRWMLDSKPIIIAGTEYPNSIAVRAPSRLVFDLETSGPIDLLTCQAALCESSFKPDRYPTATFEVVADGALAATASNLHDARPRKLIANIQGAKRLELRVTRPGQEPCDCVWLEPKVEPWPAQGILDPIGQVRIHRPMTPIVAQRCIVTMASPGLARWLDIFLNSLKENGCCKDSALVVFRVDEDEELDSVIAEHGAYTVSCTSLVPRSSTLRPAVFSVGAAARFRSAVIAETDILVLRDISALFSAVEVCAEPMLFVAREHHRDVPYRLDEFFGPVFLGTPKELDEFGITERERAYNLQINGGVIAGSSEAIALLDSTMREFLPYSRRWVQSRRDVSAREMFVINVAMARLNNAIRIQPGYNAQLYRGAERLIGGSDPPQFMFRGEPARMLHFNARKESYAAAQFRYWKNGNPHLTLADGLDYIRRSTLKQLRSVGYVADLIRRIGLQHTRDGAALYGDELAHMNSGPGIMQIPLQLARALVWLSSKAIRSYAEIGAGCGWTFSVVTAYLNRFSRLKRSAAIDIVNSFAAYGHVKESYRVEFHLATSAQCAGQPFDLVFIDADHAYGACQEDWLRMGRHARYCMFHDINDAAVQRSTRAKTVVNLWAELNCRYASQEFLDGSANAMGIGMLCTETSA